MKRLRESSQGALRLPWETTELRYYRGRLRARPWCDRAGTQLIASVKSWFVSQWRGPHGGDFAMAGTSDLERLSPVAVSSRYLAHIAAAWDARFPSIRCTARR